MRRPWLPFVAHLPPVLWLFGDALLGGRLPYFRDVSVYYYPNYVFLERSLRAGVWPLWNPTSDAGAPFLVSYPLELLLVGTLGAEGALRLDGPLHLLLAMSGASVLARVLGLAPWGVWAAGLFFGLSGYVLSAANLFELFHTTAWTPWVVAAIVSAWRSPGPRGAVRLALASAVQVSTLGAEGVLQSAFVGAALLRERPARRRLVWTAVAAALALLLAAPALTGARALVLGTHRGEGLMAREALAWSAHPVTLADTILPRFFGDPHTFTDRGLWGQQFFPDGYPYLLSLYVGAGVVLLALLAGPFAVGARLWACAAVGVLVALGAHGPLAPLLSVALRHFRVPLKFLLCADLALCLLAAQGFARAAAGAVRLSAAAFVAPVLLIAAYPVVSYAPDLPARLLGTLVPELLDPRARLVVATAWPAAFGAAGGLLLGVVLALRSVRWAPLAGVLVGLDLLLANGQVNRFAQASFFELRPAIADLIEPARSGNAGRVFSYGVSGTPGLHFSPEMGRRNSDVWLYYLERQMLLPRTQVLDGLDGAFDEDRVGWAPVGSTLDARERVPAAFRQQHDRLRQAAVRWILSFRSLPEDLAMLRGEARLAEVLETVKLYELRQPWPRAFWTPRVGNPIVPGEGSVSWKRIDPHTVLLRVRAPAGYVVVSEGFHPAWSAVDAGGHARPIVRAGDRYWAIPTRGGDEVLTARFAPPWRPFALAACGLGVGAACGLLLFGRRRAEA